VAVETGIFAGKRGVMLNLVPEGYVVAEDAAGYIIIRPKQEPPAILAGNTASVISPEDANINPDDIPFQLAFRQRQRLYWWGCRVGMGEVNARASTMGIQYVRL
jgi:hypothetical protein